MASRSARVARFRAGTAAMAASCAHRQERATGGRSNGGAASTSVGLTWGVDASVGEVDVSRMGLTLPRCQVIGWGAGVCVGIEDARAPSVRVWAMAKRSRTWTRWLGAAALGAAVLMGMGEGAWG